MSGSVMIFSSNNLASAVNEHHAIKATVLVALILLLVPILILVIHLLQADQWARSIEDKLKEDFIHKSAQEKAPLPPVLELTKIALPRPPKLHILHEQSSILETNNELKNKHAEKTPHLEQVTKKSLESKAKHTTSEIYQQITSDKNTDIQIAWPRARGERNRLFEFLYQCAGMKFGTLDNELVTLAPSPGVNAMNQSAAPHSDWLRIAQGELAPQEIYWLNKHKLQGLPVRLLPRSIDWQLAQYVRYELGNSELSQFRASYKFSRNSLSLSDIELNGKRLNSQWLITTRRC